MASGTSSASGSAPSTTKSARLPTSRLPTSSSANPAYAGFAEEEVGSLEVGKRADFVVLGADPLADDVPLATLPVRATYVDGEAVYTAP